MRNQKIILITGVSSGIGLATLLFLAKKNYRVYGTILNLAEKDKVLLEAKKHNLQPETLQIDLRNEDSIKKAVRELLEREGGMDVLINNAGYGLRGFLDDCLMEEIRNQFDVNFFGHIALIKEVVPVMKKQGNGLIVNVSSINGKIAAPVMSVYSATKFAIEAITEALRVELFPFSIKVVAIQPANIKTHFDASAKNATRAEDPQSLNHKYFSYFLDQVKRQTGKVDPELVAKKIYQIIRSRNPKKNYLVGKNARIFLLLKALLPNCLFERMMRKKYLGV